MARFMDLNIFLHNRPVVVLPKRKQSAKHFLPGAGAPLRFFSVPHPFGVSRALSGSTGGKVNSIIGKVGWLTLSLGKCSNVAIKTFPNMLYLKRRS